jgi:hypothetical protein
MDKARARGARKVEGVSAMKDEVLKLEEIEVSHTLGGAGEVSRGEESEGGLDTTLLSDTIKYINLADVGII